MSGVSDSELNTAHSNKQLALRMNERVTFNLEKCYHGVKLTTVKWKRSNNKATDCNICFKLILHHDELLLNSCGFNSASV